MTSRQYEVIDERVAARWIPFLVTTHRRSHEKPFLSRLILEETS
jgi:hypothetical protein